jgi:hypothetical protein
MTTPALCEVCAAEGHPTALAPVGRCNTCKRPYCRSHAVLDTYGRLYGHQCTACQAAEAAKVRAEREQRRAVQAGERQRVSECIKILGERGLVPRTREERVTKKTLFGTRTESQNVPDEPAWPVGRLVWRRTDYAGDEGRIAAIPSGITRSGNLVPMDSTGGYKTLETSEQDIGLRDTPSEAEVWHKILVALERLVADLG